MIARGCFFYHLLFRTRSVFRCQSVWMPLWMVGEKTFAFWVKQETKLGKPALSERSQVLAMMATQRMLCPKQKRSCKNLITAFRKVDSTFQRSKFETSKESNETSFSQETTS